MKLNIIFLSILSSDIIYGQALSNTAFIIGAGNEGRGDDVEFWPLQTDGSSCHPVNNLPFSVFSHSAAALGSHVFTCGGTCLADTLDDCYTVDVASDVVWRPAAHMNQNRAEFSLTAMEDFLVAIGGYNGSYLETIEIFDGESWTIEEFNLIQPRFAHCSVKINDEEILVLGGAGYDGRLSSLEKVNILEESSILLGSMTMPRMYFGCAFSREENRVYVSGGFGTTSLVEYLDLDSLEWKRVANLKIGRNGHQMGMIGGKLTVFGGSGNDNEYTDSVEQYQPSQDTWEMVESMQAARYSMGMVALDC